MTSISFIPIPSLRPFASRLLVPSTSRTWSVVFVVICTAFGILLVVCLSVHSLPLSWFVNRFPIPQLIELAVPALFLFFLGRIKGNSEPKRFEGDIPLADTPVPTYQDLETFASHPNVLCNDDNIFFRYPTLTVDLVLLVLLSG